MNSKLKVLIEEDSEYMYRDLGYGAFNEDGTFMVQGEAVEVTEEDINIMYDEAFSHLLSEYKRLEGAK